MIELKRKLTEKEAFELLEIWQYKTILYEKDKEIYEQDKEYYTNIVNNIIDDLNKKDDTKTDKLLDEYCDNNLSFTLFEETLTYLKSINAIEFKIKMEKE